MPLVCDRKEVGGPSAAMNPHGRQADDDGRSEASRGHRPSRSVQVDGGEMSPLASPHSEYQHCSYTTSRTRQCGPEGQEDKSESVVLRQSEEEEVQQLQQQQQQQQQPDTVVVFPKKSFPSAGLTNLLGQLATMLKQKHRTNRLPEVSSRDYTKNQSSGGAESVTMAKGNESCVDEEWSNHQQQQQQRGPVLRPAKLAWLLITSVLLFGVIAAPVSLVHGSETSPARLSSSNQLQGDTSKRGVVCGSVDVRNSPSNLDRLKDCVVVEGFVHILLIDKYLDTSFDNYSFPLLTEITEYLLLFRVNGLKTLRKLFPNLAVIRGKRVVSNYAIVIYELMHMEEVGLTSLVHIERGGVRIEKNPKLCFANTIDWSAIAQNMDNYVKDNQKEDVCPMCPAETTEVLPNGTKFTRQCPLAPGKAIAGKEQKRLCWNANHCQIKCPDHCNKTCTADGKCCDQSCLGSCATPNSTTCTVCRYFSLQPATNRQCVNKCPDKFFDHHSRCVSEEQCYALKKPIQDDSDQDLPEKPFMTHNNSCIKKCPASHEVETDKSTGRRWCRKCDKGECRKKCPGGNIDDIATAQGLRTCDIIDGSLTIQLRSRGGENIVKELEESLSSITEIRGYLKIVRSYPLLSLGFFKNLKIIHGVHSKIANSSVYIVENQNLQELFDHNVTIREGKLFFYNNPMLCVSKIKALKSFNTRIEIENEAQLGNSNGDRAACDVKELKTVLRSVSSNSVLLQWEPFTQLADMRQLLGYVVYYIEAPFQNVTFFDGRDACNTEGWKLDDVSDNDPESKVNKLLTTLKSYTQYAYYVKTYTLASEGVGGQSKIQYFRTAPGTPDAVRDVKVEVDIVKQTLTVSWNVPPKMNGKLSDYEIFAEFNAEVRDLLKQRNYCNEAMANKPVSEQPTPAPSPTHIITGGTCSADQCSKYCTPGEPSKEIAIDTSEAELKINFEDQLHNHVYIKNQNVRDSSTRRKRSPQGNSGNQTSILFPTITDKTSTPTVDRTTTKASNESYYQTLFNSTNVTSITYPLSYFNHYAMYAFKIRACRQKAEHPGNVVKLVDSESACSNEVIYNYRTPKKPGADDILFDTITVEAQYNGTQRSIKVTWAEPRRPNGPIVAYQITHQRMDLDDTIGTGQCQTQTDFNNTGYFFLHKMEPGNYSIRIQATTIAGNGPLSPPKFVLIKKDESHSITFLWIVLVAMFVILMAVGVVGFWWYKVKYLPIQNVQLIAQVNPDYAGVIYRVDEWEVDREHIIQLEELGQGSFGMVYKGILTQLRGIKKNTPCAIKTVNENATTKERDSFLIEASVMKQFNTNHVVRLLGVVSQGDPTLVIMELMENGDLKGYLRRHRPDYENGDEPSPQPPTLRQIYQMAIEIADGMAYLSAKKFVHRDLAARNCMVAEDLTVKIGDFGMTRDIYETDYYRKGTKGFLPVRWMSPESLKDGVFSSSSDVFSYGVVLWEMATLASQPYQGLTNDQVLRYVIEGGVMERPENCPDKLYDLMRRCWQHRPTARPSFIDIINMLLPDANDRFHAVSFFNSNEAQEMAPLHQHQIYMDDVTTPLTGTVGEGGAGGTGGGGAGLVGDDDDDDDDVDQDEEMHIGDVGTDDEYSMELTNSHLVPNNGPMATIRSPHSPLSEQLGNRLICDSLAISYHSRDIDDTIAEEDEEEQEEEEEEQEDLEQYEQDGGGPSALEQVVVVGGGAAPVLIAAAGSDRNRRSTSRNRQNSNNSRRVKSRSVSPGYSDHGSVKDHRTTTAAARRRNNRRSDSGLAASHDYVNSAPGGGGLVLSGFGGTLGDGGTSGFDSSSRSSGGGRPNFGGSIPAIPPPPQKQQPFFTLPRPCDEDSDPYGKEFDAISTDSSRISAANQLTPATGSRINGRVNPPGSQQPDRKEPPRLRNGFVERVAGWPQGSTGEA